MKTTYDVRSGDYQTSFSDQREAVVFARACAKQGKLTTITKVVRRDGQIVEYDRVLVKKDGTYKSLS